MELIRRYKQGKLTQADMRIHNKTVLCLMVLIAISSLMWIIALAVLTGDFYNGIISAKLLFRERDDRQKDNEIFQGDLHKILDEVYADDAITTAWHNFNSTATSERPTKKPRVPKIAHVYASIKDTSPADKSLNGSDAANRTTATEESSVPVEVNDTTHSSRAMRAEDEQLVDNAAPSPPPTTTTLESANLTETNARLKPKATFDPQADRAFLSNMSVDSFETYWSEDVKAQFVYNFPFLSEMVSIIWAVMCFIYQTGGSKKAWGLPKPWRIVVPSLVVFAVMSLANLVYTIMTNGYVKQFCSDLRSNLTKPDIISCGQAITLLRPYIRPHSVPHEAYLNIFRACYIGTMVLWLLSLLLMLLRYFLAIDFQLVDVEDVFERHLDGPDVKLQQVLPYIEVPLDGSPQHQIKQQNFQQQQLQQTQKQQQPHVRKDRPKSEDDFQSAKSHLSELATPLLADGQRLLKVA